MSFLAVKSDRGKLLFEHECGADEVGNDTFYFLIIYKISVESQLGYLQKTTPNYIGYKKKWNRKMGMEECIHM